MYNPTRYCLVFERVRKKKVANHCSTAKYPEHDKRVHSELNDTRGMVLGLCNP